MIKHELASDLSGSESHRDRARIMSIGEAFTAFAIL